MIDHFLKKYLASNEVSDKSFSVEAIEVLCNYDWPGNVRELQAVIERVLALSKDEVICAYEIHQQLGDSIEFPDSNLSDLSFLEAKENNIREFEKRYFNNLLKRTKGNVMQASKACRR